MPNKSTTRNQTVGLRMKKARLVTFFGFFQLGAMMFIWSTGTSPLRNHLGWSGAEGDASFGSLALAIGIGAAVGCFAIGPFIDRFGPRRTVSLTLIAYPLSYIPLCLLEDLVGAIFVGVLLGLLRGAGDTAVNAHGVQVEQHYRRPIMSAFHAAYPAGGFLGGIIGSAFAQHFTDSPLVSFSIMGLVMAAIGLALRPWLLSPDEVIVDDPDSTDRTASKSGQAKGIIAAMVAFGILLLGSQLSEGALIDWGQEFVRREIGTSAAVAGTAVSLYSGAQFLGRLFGDRIAEKIGARLMVAMSGVIATLGALIILLGDTVTISLAGFALMGLGLASMAPLMLSAAGRRDPANAGRNIGMVNALGYGGMLVGPAAITVIVDTFGLGLMPLLPAVLLALVAATGPLLMRQTPRYAAQAEERAMAAASTADTSR